MSDPLRDTSPGESPARLLNASTFNLTMAAARWVRANGQVAAGRRGAIPGTEGANDARLEVRVRASATLPQWGIVTLGGAVIDPEAAAQNANNTPVFEAAAPVAGGLPAVLMQPLSAGRIGRAVVAGVCVAPVNISSSAHRYARPVAGDLFGLVSATTGPFRLLTLPGDGTHICLVLLGSKSAEEAAAGGCAGCGWVAGLTDLDCLLATVVERLGRCACAEPACSTTTTAARYPTVSASAAPGDAAWNTPALAEAADGDSTFTSELDSGQTSESLVVSGFGFAVPSGATVLGVALSMGRFDSSGNGEAYDHTVRLMKAGAATGGNKASLSAWPGAIAETTYGGAADLWGTTWTPAEVNAAGFGVLVRAQAGDLSAVPGVDWIRLTVTYEECSDPATNDGPVYLASEDGEDWTATGDGTTVTICGVEYALTFSREGCDGPCLTLTSGGGSGTAYTAVRDCCGPNYAIFSIGNVAVCTGTTDTEAGPVGNVARIKVEWSCCPIDGWAGEGYYCVRDAGTEDDCTSVELTDDDKCDDTIEICSGPYSTLVEAQAACPTITVGGGSCAVGTPVPFNEWVYGSAPANGVSGYLQFFCVPITGGAQYKIEAFAEDIPAATARFYGTFAAPCNSSLDGIYYGIATDALASAPECYTYAVVAPEAATHICLYVENLSSFNTANFGFKISAGACP